MGTNEEYAKKLKERREAEQRRLLEKRKEKQVPSSRQEFALPEETSQSIRKVKTSDNISKEDIERTIATGAISAESVKKITDAPPNETDEEREARLLKVRKEVYEKHKRAIEKKYQEAKATISEKKQQEISEAEEEHKSTIDEHKSDLDETLEDNDDPSDRRDARQNYRDSVAEEEEAHKDNLASISEEYKESFDSLKDEFNTKLDDLLEQYEQDTIAIKEGTFADADLELCNREFEAETITFEALEEYESDEESSSYSRSDYEYSGGFNFIGFAMGAIGIGVVVMVGYMVLGQVTTALESTGQYNTTGISELAPVTNLISSPMFMILLFLPFMLIFLNTFRRMFRGGFV